MDQPGKVANPARGQLNRENDITLSPCVPENLVSRDGFSRPVPRQPAHLHTQADIWCLLTGFLPISAAASIYVFLPPYVSGSVPSCAGELSAVNAIGTQLCDLINSGLTRWRMFFF